MLLDRWANKKPEAVGNQRFLNRRLVLLSRTPRLLFSSKGAVNHGCIASDLGGLDRILSCVRDRLLLIDGSVPTASTPVRALQPWISMTDDHRTGSGNVSLVILRLIFVSGRHLQWRTSEG